MTMTDSSGWATGPTDSTATTSVTDSLQGHQYHRPGGWPHRSRTDRKFAGVAGGLGRALGIDPVLLRVAFVVLTVFGGFGGLLYVIGWLLLPDDGEEYSAAQSLLGRGSSSMPRPLAVGLVIVAAVSVASMFSWGLPFWPVVVIGVIILVSMGRRGGPGPHRSRSQWQQRQEQAWQQQQSRQDSRWEQHAERQARRWAERADRWERKATAWGSKAEGWLDHQGWGGGCGRSRDARPGSSSTTAPFPQPAFWDQPRAADRGPGRAPTSGSAKTPEDAPVDEPIDDPLTPRTPPAWDPLGAAPFAWDLPEPSPMPAAPPARMRRGGAGIARATLGTALVGGGVAVGLTLAGVWSLSWAQVAAIPLVVVALGLLLSAAAGRGLALVAPAVLLTVATMALGVTGLHGTAGYGNENWQVTNGTLVSSYTLQAGEGTLDLSQVVVPKGQTLSTELTVRAGRATVKLPQGSTSALTCTVAAGQAVCLDHKVAGLHESVQLSNVGTDSDAGTLDVTVTVHGGFAEVSHG